MFDRHWLSDLALAVLLTLPLVGLARSYSPPQHQTFRPVAVSVAAAERLPSGRVSLLG